MKNIINVTSPALPPLSEVISLLKIIWENKRLTNQGPFHDQFEKELCKYLNVENISLFTNASLAILTSIKALRLTGNIITTPYTFVATTHAIKWAGLEPKFVDINPSDCNINPKLIENAIDDDTSAILAVNCYGNPCQINNLTKISKEHNIKLIIDAAQSFGVKYKKENIFIGGDLSVVSFHATKTFNTFEGGAVITKNLEIKKRLDKMKNFGFEDEINITEIGLNCKMNEFSSLLGIVQLKYIDEYLKKRKKIAETYFKYLSNIEGIETFTREKFIESNNTYFPIIVNSKYPKNRDELYRLLRSNGILTRRYFYPLISNLKMYSHLNSSKRSNLPEANRIAKQVLCLPIYPDLSKEDQYRILDLIKEFSN